MKINLLCSIDCLWYLLCILSLRDHTLKVYV